MQRVLDWKNNESEASNAHLQKERSLSCPRGPDKEDRLSSPYACDIGDQACDGTTTVRRLVQTGTSLVTLAQALQLPPASTRTTTAASIASGSRPDRSSASRSTSISHRLRSGTQHLGPRLQPAAPAHAVPRRRPPHARSGARGLAGAGEERGGGVAGRPGAGGARRCAALHRAQRGTEWNTTAAVAVVVVVSSTAPPSPPPLPVRGASAARGDGPGLSLPTCRGLDGFLLAGMTLLSGVQRLNLLPGCARGCPGSPRTSLCGRRYEKNALSLSLSLSLSTPSASRDGSTVLVHE